MTASQVSDQQQIDDQKKKEEFDKQAKKDPISINSKITLKKKSGPGELVGVTELDSQNGKVSFSGLQFTEPGDYVILVIPSSSELDQTEIQIKVEPADEIIEQDPKGQEEPIKGTRPIIAQIDAPTIKLNPMEFDATNNSTDNSNITTGLGFVPFLWFGAYQIRPEDIQKLSLFYDDFVPKLFVILQDSVGFINNPDTAPTVNSNIELFFNSGTDKLKSIHLKFLIDQKKNNKNGTITIFGKLDLRDFYKIDYKAYFGTSFQVLRDISKELGLGFNSNIEETNDSMKWVRNGMNQEKFIRDVLSKSYISDDSFMAGYIDYYYCFNYVDVEKEYNRDNSDDVGLESTGIQHLSNEEEKISKLFLTTDKGANSSPMHISRHSLRNNSTNQITNEGATTDSKVYDRIGKRFLKFKVDGLTSPDDKLKTLRSEDDINTNYRTEYTGKLDTDNVHENFLYAKTQNTRNLTNLANVMADLTLTKPNFNLYKFQKIKIIFTNDKSTPSDPQPIDRRYSGDWIIIDISFTYQKSELQQTLVVARKELTKTEDEVKNETTKQETDKNSEINENQITEPVPVIPNSIYSVGQQVKIEQNGKVYTLNVERVSDNGIEISGKIVESIQKLPASADITPPPQSPEKDLNIKTKVLFISYTDSGSSLVANVTFLINDTKEVDGVGSAPLPPEGKAKQKENAVKIAEIDAINKYKASNQTTNTNTTPDQHAPTGSGDPAQNATASSKKGYIYSYEVDGQRHRVLVKDKLGGFIFNTSYYELNGNKTKDMLVEDAIIGANDKN